MTNENSVNGATNGVVLFEHKGSLYKMTDSNSEFVCGSLVTDQINGMKCRRGRPSKFNTSDVTFVQK